MKHAVLTLSAILLVSALAYAAYFHIATGTHKGRSPHHTQDSLVWIEQEFNLSADALQAVKSSHAIYLPKCQEASSRLLAARKHLTAWPPDALPSATELQEAHQAVLQLEHQCFEMAVAHIFEIGALMGPDEGPRYQKIMLLKLMTLEGREHRPIGNLLETST
ncbi:hypothetical protein V2O64_18030 [Verrucomicrobiaceae bacterium 227]